MSASSSVVGIPGERTPATKQATASGAQLNPNSAANVGSYISPAQTIYQAFVAVCAAVENVKRDTPGQVGNSKYMHSTIDSIVDMVRPLLAVNGLALGQYVDGDLLKATLIHTSGTMIEFGSYNLGPLGKHQERGSAITYGRKYQLCGIFGIAQEDDDGAAASVEKKNNSPTNGPQIAQQVFGTAKEFKEYYLETHSAINRMSNAEQAGILNRRIAKIELVDDQAAMILRDALELQLDGFAAHD